MKRFLMVLALVGSVSASAQTPREAAMPETVSVTGTSRVQLAPDRYTFTLGVQTVAPTVDDAVKQNNDRVAAIIAALKRAGATDKEIRTSNFSIYPQQDHSEGRLPRILGYQVSNMVTVTRSSVGDAGRLLTAAVNAGVNTASGIQFEVSDPARGRDQGLKAAYEDARQKAATLAAASGRTIGRALSITEGGAAAPPPIAYGRVMAMKAEVAQDIPVEAGSQENHYTVSVIFELR